MGARYITYMEKTELILKLYFMSMPCTYHYTNSAKFIEPQVHIHEIKTVDVSIATKYCKYKSLWE